MVYISFRNVQEELHNERLAELDAITAERDEGRMRFEELRKQRLDQFMTGFSTITYKLKEMYQVWLSPYTCEGLCVCGCECECYIVHISKVLL